MRRPRPRFRAALAGCVALTGSLAFTGCSAPAPDAATPGRPTPARPVAVAPDSSPPRLVVPAPARARPEARAPQEAAAPPSLSPVLSTEPWTFAGRAGRLITTPNFRVHTTLEDSPLLARVPVFLELALLQYTSAIGALPMPKTPMAAYMLATRPQWEEVTRKIAGTNAHVYLSVQRGGFALNGTGVYWDIGAHDALQLAAHEGWHQYTQTVFAQPLPIWLEEGLATYMEGFRWHPQLRDTPMFLPWANPERFDHLRDLVARDELVPLDELLQARPQDLIASAGDASLGYYAQVWALVHYLVEGRGTPSRDRLHALLRDAAGGTLYSTVRAAAGPDAARRAALTRRGDAVFTVYFAADLAAADADYRAFIARVVRVGGRDAVIAGRSPLAPD